MLFNSDSHQGIKSKGRALFYSGLFIVILSLLPDFALAVQMIQVKKPIEVYVNKSRRSRIITTLQPGDTAPVSKADYGAWYKVLVQVEGKKRPGFVTKVSTRGSPIRESSKSAAKGKAYKDGIGVGLVGTFAYNQQGEREFDSGDGETIQIDALSGSALYFGLFADFPLTANVSLRGGLSFRQNNMTGSLSITGDDKQTVELTQSFLAVSGLLKYYPSTTGSFWLGGGLELANGVSVSLKYADSDDVPVDNEDLPFFVYLNGALGADLNIAGNFFIIPDFRLGVVVNTSPMIVNVEGNINFAYRF